MKKLISFILISVFFLSACAGPLTDKTEIENKNKKEDKPRIEKISFSVAGDVLMHDALIRAGQKSDGSYDYTPFFSQLEPEIKSSDFAIANMEGTLAGADKKYTGYPLFNCPDEVALALKESGFDIVTTANNHTLDRGAYGAKRTLDVLDKYGLLHTGSYRSLADSQEILIFSAHDIKVALLNYTYSTNGNPIPKDMPYVVNMIDRAKVISDIKKARALGADIVMVASHLGTEYERQPNQEQKALYADLIKEGADVIIGDHPHVLQPMEYINVNSDTGPRNGLVFYSMGNFISNQFKRYRDSGAVMHFEFEKNFATGRVKITNVNAIDTLVTTYYSQGKLLYRVLPVDEAIKSYEEHTDPYLTLQNYQRLKEVKQENAELLNLKTVQEKIQNQ